MEDDKPKLVVVSGGKDNTSKSKRSGKTEAGLTAKQLKFVEGLVSGLSNADAYRAAYDTSAMKPGTIYNEASKLALRPDIATMVADKLSQKSQRNSMGALKQSERVWRNVWRLAEGENVPPAVQQSALALAAKMAGMLTDKVEIENKSADSKTIEAELLERLQRLTG